MTSIDPRFSQAVSGGQTLLAVTNELFREFVSSFIWDIE